MDVQRVGRRFQFLKRFDSRFIRHLLILQAIHVSIPQKVRFKDEEKRGASGWRFCFNSSKGSIQGVNVDFIEVL